MALTPRGVLQQAVTPQAPANTARPMQHQAQHRQQEQRAEHPARQPSGPGPQHNPDAVFDSITQAASDRIRRFESDMVDLVKQARQAAEQASEKRSTATQAELTRLRTAAAAHVQQVAAMQASAQAAAQREDELQGQIARLQEQLAARDSENMRLRSEFDAYKQGVKAFAEATRQLTETLNI